MSPQLAQPIERLDVTFEGPATNTSIQIRLTTFFQDTLTVFEMGCL